MASEGPRIDYKTSPSSLETPTFNKQFLQIANMDTWLSTFAIGTSGTYDLRALLHDCSKQVATEGRAESAQHSTHWIENCCESSSNCHLDPLNVKFLIGSATTPSELCQSTFLRVQLQCSVSQPSCCEGQCKIPLDASPQNLEEFFEDVKSNFGHLVEGLSDLEWNKLPDLVKEHIKNNPKMTAVHAVSLIVGFTPGLVWGPAFTSLGFTSLGPMVGM